LAALELGHSSVQKLAQKIQMSRPTVYRILEALQKKELIEKLERKKGSAVIPKSPDELLGLLRIQKRKVEEQEREFLRIISLLKTHHTSAVSNAMEIYSGEAGKKFVLEEFSTTHAKKIFVLFNAGSGITQKELGVVYEKIRKRIGKLEVTEICPEKTTTSPLPYVERKISENKFPSTVIVGQKILIFSQDQILCIKEESIVELLKFFFQSF
jgi:sugar-specific transcriptional regulator TrmB